MCYCQLKQTVNFKTGRKPAVSWFNKPNKPDTAGKTPQTRQWFTGYNEGGTCPVVFCSYGAGTCNSYTAQ